MTAVSAFKNKWRQMKAWRETPLPRAVRAKFKFEISSTAARVVRRIAAPMPRLSTKAGKMIC